MITFLLSPLGRGLLSGGVIIAAFLVWLSSHDAKVEQRVVTNINEVNTNATNLGGSAAAGSADRRVSGKRDPTTRDD